MRLRTALNEYKRRRDDRFPEECRTVAGAFSGGGDRLVYVGAAGAVRDYSAALSGLHGIDRSRFGVEADDEVRWTDDMTPVGQSYYRDTTLVRTEFDAGEYTAHRQDLTLGRTHVTGVELRGTVPPDARLAVFVTFAPEGSEWGIGRLVHDRGDGTVVEVFHRAEHNYVTASTDVEAVVGQVPERFDEVLGDEAVDFPREVHPERDEVTERYEETHLTGDVLLTVPLERTDHGVRTTLVTRLSDRTETTRQGVLSDVEHVAGTCAGTDAIRAAARERASGRLHAGDSSRPAVVTDDLRSLSLLTAPTGARIAAPEFDPFAANTGGYGYTWLRDDAEVSLSLLVASDSLSLDVDADLARACEVYCESQLADGTWPHRLWAVDGSVAPGWAHARLEGADTREYQADQTASVVAFLATLLRERPDVLDPDYHDRLEECVASGVGGLDATLESDGLPERCQNCWENMEGRFTHTAATFLRAYAAVARAPVADRLAARAASRVERVLGGLDALWTGDHYALRLDGDGFDGRLDSATFALVPAVVSADAVGNGVDDPVVDRLQTHVHTTVDGLYREREAVAGLVRFEGDRWRTADQEGEKIWSLATAWGGLACTRLAAFLEDRGDEPEPFYERARDLYELVLPDGPQCTGVGYLPEQVFDDGTPDSAVPLGWSHALRLETTVRLAARGELPPAASSTLEDDPD